MKHRIRTIWQTAFAALLSLALLSCNVDPTSTFTLALTIDDVDLTADGSDLARVRVTVLDQSGYPPPIGSSVFLRAEGANVNQTGEITGDSFTDAVGTAQFTVQCAGEGQVQAIALYQSDNGFLREQINCSPAPTGEWTIQSSAEPRRLQTRSASQLTIAGLQETGEAVPTGTAILLEIVDGEGVTFNSGSTSQLRTTDDPSGTLTATVFSGEFETEATICAKFADQRFGTTASCVILIVNDLVIEEALCAGAYSDPNPRADGETITRMTFTVFADNGAPVADADININILSGELLEFEDSATGADTLALITDANGDAEAFVQSPSEAGSASLTATAFFRDPETDDDVELLCQISELTFAPPPDCLFVPDRFPMDPAIIGVRDGGRPERGALRACFTDVGGVPIAPGQRVNFQTVSGHTDSTLVATRSLTDAEGCANTELKAGSQAGTVEVRATLDFGANASTCTTGPLSIRGGRPSAGDFIVHCDAENLGSLLEARGDEVRSTCEVPCFVYATDRFGNSLPDRTNNDDNTGQATISELSVFFATEQGIISSPGLDRGDQYIETVWIPRGDIPNDVVADTVNGELPGPGTTGSITTNPRDGLVTIIAYTTGEEQFFDENGNGIYDDGERFVDLPEPFIDINDNNTYDPEIGERYFEVNTSENPADGTWSAGNGVWDDVTTIWTQTHVLLTGRHHISASDPLGLHGFFGPAGQMRSANITVPPTGTFLEFLPTDANGNTTSPTTTFTSTSTCSRLTSFDTVTNADRFGAFEIAERYAYFGGGLDDLSFDDDWDYSRPRVTFDHDPVTNFLQSFRVEMVPQPGPAEVCSLTIDYGFSEAAACGAGEGRSATFGVTVAAVTEDVP